MIFWLLTRTRNEQVPVELDGKALKPLRASLAAMQSAGEGEVIRLWGATAQVRRRFPPYRVVNCRATYANYTPLTAKPYGSGAPPRRRLPRLRKPLPLSS